MDAEMLQVLIPIVAILTTFGFPVALIFTLKWFKLKERELQLDVDLRKHAGEALESAEPAARSAGDGVRPQIQGSPPRTWTRRRHRHRHRQPKRRGDRGDSGES